MDSQGFEDTAVRAESRGTPDIAQVYATLSVAAAIREQTEMIRNCADIAAATSRLNVTAIGTALAVSADIDAATMRERMWDL